SSWRGDPSSALLEVLDPAQNNTFRDHYLEVDLDLSEVLFIPTANVWETIPGPLLDRMELIRLDGYTSDEKLAIARDHLIGRQIAQAGLKGDEISVADDAMRDVIASYTREAGVRSLERQLGKPPRKAAPGVADGTSVPGVATGLAVTGAGGDVLFVEAATAGDKGTLTLTGQLGDVMKES